MAGAKEGVFIEKLSPFLKQKLDEARAHPTEHQALLRTLERQYVKDVVEEQIDEQERRRHYESEMHIMFEGRPLKGVERLYRRSMVIEPTTVCAAHCRWCLRGQYEMFHLNEEDMTRVARYVGESEVTQDLREVLVTGGDPFMVPDKLDYLITELGRCAPQLKIIRIGTRVPLHQPSRVNEDFVNMLARHRPRFGIEIGLHVNHSSELFPEVCEALARLRGAGARIYDQTVLLKGVNDSVPTLVELFENLRYQEVEAHYLFHCIPLRGMKHHRTSITRGLELAHHLTSSGHASGRSKPKFTLLTDVGKVTLYEDSILERDKENNILLQTGYRYEDRTRWNPLWQLPKTALIDDQGFLRVWYLDAVEEDAATPA